LLNVNTNITKYKKRYTSKMYCIPLKGDALFIPHHTQIKKMIVMNNTTARIRVVVSVYFVRPGG